MIHADNYCLADFRAFEQAHWQRPLGCIMTMMTFRTHDPSSCGIVELDERGVVVGFHEKVAEPQGIWLMALCMLSLSNCWRKWLRNCIP